MKLFTNCTSCSICVWPISSVQPCKFCHISTTETCSCYVGTKALVPSVKTHIYSWGPRTVLSCYSLFESLCPSVLSRTLGTPNNNVWPDVESLPDYKNTFPKWKSGNLSSMVKNLDKNGLDLLAVRSRTESFHSFNLIECVRVIIVYMVSNI